MPGARERHPGTGKASDSAQRHSLPMPVGHCDQEDPAKKGQNHLKDGTMAQAASPSWKAMGGGTWHGGLQFRKGLGVWS